MLVSQRARARARSSDYINWSSNAEMHVKEKSSLLSTQKGLTKDSRTGSTSYHRLLHSISNTTDSQLQPKMMRTSILSVVFSALIACSLAAPVLDRRARQTSASDLLNNVRTGMSVLSKHWVSPSTIACIHALTLWQPACQ